MALFRSQPRFTHLVGKDARIEGTLVFGGSMLFEGEQLGPVTSLDKKAVLAVKGTIRGDVMAGVVHVEGRIVGDVTAHTVVVRAGGSIVGKVHAQVLHVEEKGSLSGGAQIAPAATVTVPSPVSEGSAQGARERLQQVQQHDHAERRTAQAS